MGNIIVFIIAATPSRTDPLIDPHVVDIAVLCIGLLIAVAAVWLQWANFKRNHPIRSQNDQTRAPFGQVSSYNRWKNIYWREVRATLGLALISLLMVGLLVFFKREITMLSLASVMFWVGMFFYNLWVAQWYAWRITTKRKR